jgi:transcriptional regulator with XRE-family HTH domain
MSEMTAGEWLRGEMERRGLATRDVAEAVGLRDQAVYYWLTGRTAPKDDAAAKLAELIDVPEVEVRRRFGLWVPNDPPNGDPDSPREHEIDAALDVMRAAIAELERIKRGRRAG